MSTAQTKDMSGPIVAAGWAWPRLVVIVLCLLGMAVSGYMSWAELTGNETACADTGNIDCAAVQDSAYGKTLGFPVAVMGFLGYVLILGIQVLEDQVNFLATYGRTLIFGMALFGFLFQTYLFVVEITILDAICQWCVISHILIGGIMVVGGYRLYLFLRPLRD